MKRGFFQWASVFLRGLLWPIAVAVDFLNELLVWDGVLYHRARMVKDLFSLIAPWVLLLCAAFEFGGLTGEFRGAVMVAAVTWIIGSGEAASGVFPKKETDESKIAERIGAIASEMKEGKAKTKSDYPVACSGHFQVQADDAESADCKVKWRICSIDTLDKGSAARFIIGHVVVGSSRFEFDSFHSSINVLEASFVTPEFCSQLVGGDLRSQQKVVDHINSMPFIGGIKLKMPSWT